ncbi:DinB family protein [Edaphobacter modestus]|uniref:DinB family protein n=1 Tax=Edaphobacter modestus TaxID=388466 RepID=A0A4Q7YWB5_9BACT|nr:DinB family protein [Edaphobacter modestus]RZU41383.1 DinB family protein [Edaphobacter modestus]
MGITYTQGTDPARLDSVELSERLSATIRAAVPWLVTLSDADAGTPEAEGKWSAKEILGHLTDSAINNLSRIVRMQIGSERMPGYDQQSWVALQHYRDREWAQVLALWFALNEHLVWVIRHIDLSRLSNQGVVADSPLTLGFLIEDYIAHMEHHFHALRRWEKPGKSTVQNSGLIS